MSDRVLDANVDKQAIFPLERHSIRVRTFFLAVRTTLLPGNRAPSFSTSKNAGVSEGPE